MEQTAIKTASKLLQRVYHNTNSAETMAFVGIVKVMEEKNETSKQNINVIVNAFEEEIKKESDK